jgi:hypothetical protein
VKLGTEIDYTHTPRNFALNIVSMSTFKSIVTVQIFDVMADKFKVAPKKINK